MGNRVIVLVCVLGMALGLATVVQASEVASADKVKVVAMIPPVGYFVERVGGPDVEVTVLVGPGQEPHTFEPTPRTVTALGNANVLFRMRFPFEETLVKKVAKNVKNLQIVDLQQGITMRPVSEEEEKQHSHGKGKRGHSHDGDEMDQHTWLSPQFAKIQARTIADSLSQIRPSRAEFYQTNLKTFEDDLDALHQRLLKALEPLKGKKFYVFHPAFGYFGDAYGLTQVPVEVAGKEPTAKQLARLVEKAQKDGVKVIFVQPQFSKKSAETLARELGAVVVPLDDLAPNYLKNLEEMAGKLESALQRQIN